MRWVCVWYYCTNIVCLYLCQQTLHLLLTMGVCLILLYEYLIPIAKPCRWMSINFNETSYSKMNVYRRICAALLIVLKIWFLWLGYFYVMQRLVKARKERGSCPHLTPVLAILVICNPYTTHSSCPKTTWRFQFEFTISESLHFCDGKGKNIVCNIPYGTSTWFYHSLIFW